jgi:2-polyprenyl-6-methoxyphenol hydroxylase-like FAD-dependent oxidoreductase
MTTRPKVLIVGGGIAGMSLAIRLRQQGIQAEIVERKTDWTVLGVGIILQGPALRALQKVGVLDRCLQEGFGGNELQIGGVEGHVFACFPQPQLAGPQYPATIGILRPALHTILMEAAHEADVSIRLGLSVASLTQDADAVEVDFTDGTRDRYDLVVGADGIYSQVRELIFGTSIKPKYVGQIVWRANLKRPPEVTTPSMWYGPRNKAGFCPFSQQGMYLFLTQNVPTPTRPEPEQLPALLREQLADYQGLVGEVREQITDPQEINHRPLESVLLPSPWYRGRVLLIGDAAHATTPHLANGAAMAIEDAVVLSDLLASDAPVSQVLEEFMLRRYERCRMVVENSLQLVEWEKESLAPDARYDALMGRSVMALAEPI